MCDTKKCTKCGRELPLDQFYKQKSTTAKVWYDSWCKDCKRIACAEWRKNNKERIKASHVEWCRNNMDKCRAYDVKRRRNNPEKKRAKDARWYYNNIDKARAYSRRWQKDNPEKCRVKNARWRKNNPGYSARYENNRKSNDIVFRITKNIKSAIRLALVNNAKSGRAVDLLGCPIEYLRNYLECLFQPGMTWDNYGRNGWHIDHIIPLSYFDMSDPEQQKRAWHYTNLQPLWAVDNLKKSNKIEERQLVLL